MNKEVKKKYYNLCNPIKFQTLDSGIVLDVDDYKIEGNLVNPRGERWANTIADKISWSDEPQVIYFSGYTGSGKTTELQRAIKILEDEGDANLLSVYIDSIDFIDKHSKVELVDVLTMIVYNVTKSVYKHIGKSEEEAFKERNFFSKLWNSLNQDILLKDIEVELYGANMIFEMKNRPDFRASVRENLKAHISKFKDDVIKELSDLNDLVKRYENNKTIKSGIVVIIDSLEKNRGIADEVDKVAACAERLFKDRLSLTLPIHSIYTVPPYIANIMTDIDFLPVIRLFDKAGEKFEDGVEVMKALIYDRVPQEDLREMINDEDLEKLILFSGGYPRDLLHMLQEVIMSKTAPIEDDKLERIFMKLKNKYLEATPSEFYEKLRTIDKTNKLDLTQSEHRKMAFELFDSHAILRYMNGGLWWGLHPALKKVLETDA